MKLIEAVQDNDLELVKELIGEGYPINKKDVSGFTALMEASLFGYVEIIKELIRAGASINEKSNNGNTALILVCASIDEKCEDDDISYDKEIVKELIKSGASICIKNNDGETALDYSVEMWQSYDMQDLILSMYPHLVGFLKDNVELHKDIYDKYYKVIDMSDLNIF